MSSISLPQVTGSQAIRALQKAGFVVRRQSGSHAILVHSADLSRRCVVVVHGSKSIKPGTLKSILKGCQLSIEEFKALL